MTSLTPHPTNSTCPRYLTGGALGALNYWVNLRQLSNGVALWLGISPPDLFFYAFIPPLAVDSALKLDFFLFKKVCGQVPTPTHSTGGGRVGLCGGCLLLTATSV